MSEEKTHKMLLKVFFRSPKQVKQFIASVADLLVNPLKWGAECKDTALLKDALKLSAGNGSSSVRSFREMLKLMEELF